MVAYHRENNTAADGLGNLDTMDEKRFMIFQVPQGTKMGKICEVYLFHIGWFRLFIRWEKKK